MFNVIKGQYVTQSSEPVLIKREIGKVKIGKSKEEIECEQKAEEAKQITNDLNNKKEEIQKLEKKLSEKKRALQEEANEILQDAEEKAKYEMQVSQNRGYQDGYQAGEQKGITEGIEQAKDLIIKAQTIVDEAIQFKEETIRDNEDGLLNLAIDIAKSIIKKEVIDDIEITKNNIRAALKRVPISKNLKIIVNWKDMEHIREMKNSLVREIHGVDNIEIIEDKNMEKGGAILETSIGTIDATINSQLQTIYERLQEVQSDIDSEDDVEIIEADEIVDIDLEDE